jgi:hypothetical protein
MEIKSTIETHAKGETLDVVYKEDDPIKDLDNKHGSRPDNYNKLT